MVGRFLFLLVGSSFLVLTACAGGGGSSDGIIRSVVEPKTPSVGSLSFIPQESEVNVSWQAGIASLREQLEDNEEIEQVIINWRTSFDSDLLAQFNQESRNSLLTRLLQIGGIGGDQVEQEGDEELLRKRHQVVDLDRDGIPFTGDPGGDNCPGDYNPNQADDDDDGYGDVCDPAPNNPLLLIPANRSVVIKWQDSQAARVESWTIRFMDINRQSVAISPAYIFSHDGGSQLSARLSHDDTIGGQAVVLANDKPYRFSVSVVFTGGETGSLYDFTDPEVTLGSNHDGDLIRDLEDEDDDNDGILDVEETEPEHILRSAIGDSLVVGGDLTENILTGLVNNSEYIFSLEALIESGGSRGRRELANGTILLGPNPDNDGLANEDDEDDDGDKIEDLDEPPGCALKTDCDKDGLTDFEELNKTEERCITTPDCDGDNAIDSLDAFVLDATESEDTDGDGIGNNRDDDIDGDGTANEEEEDKDNDGLLDSLEVVGCDRLVDCDSDGLRDADEPLACMTMADCDNDGILDGAEVPGCVQSADCDGDTIEDGLEVAQECIISADCDKDGVEDWAEHTQCVRMADCDNDGLGDSEEIGLFYEGLWCGLARDCDKDSLRDFDEASYDKSCINSRDCDGDNVSDSTEIVRCIFTADCDQDGVSDNDEVERRCILDSDCDGDGIADGDEPSAFCRISRDCDNDFLPDSEERWLFNSDGVSCILLSDCDGDNMFDFDEILNCVTTADCDGDGVSDNDEPRRDCILKEDCDQDGLDDGLDSCPLMPRGQDSDQDGCPDDIDRPDPPDPVVDPSEIVLQFRPEPTRVNLDWVNPHPSQRIRKIDISYGEVGEVGRQQLSLVGVTGIANQYFSIAVSGLEDNTQYEFTIEINYADSSSLSTNGQIWTGLNSDGDGIRDAEDEDDNNNGVLDEEEDAASCIRDNDCDDDGVLDTVENSLFNASSGVSCSMLPDCDEDSVVDGDEAASQCLVTPDCDGDGVLDPVDLFPLDGTEWEDTDIDGIGNNGDNCPMNANPSQINTDGAADGGDACDSDDDNDGFVDTSDAFPLNPAEWLDDDNDGIGNNRDNCVSVANPDQRNTDNDLNGGDACDEDDDNDRFVDTNDAFPLDRTEWEDTDNDRTGNNADRDDDNDGLLDTDIKEQLTNVAGISCSLLADCDGDGVADGEDAFPIDPQETADSDGDSWGDNSDNCPQAPNPDQINTDGDDDGGDACDEDDDNDGHLDGSDNCPLQSNPDQANVCAEDSDGDGVLNDQDNCPMHTNPDQNNTDGAADGGDACDEDDDNDNYVDRRDNCPLVANPDQINTDGAADGGDACDSDDDNDEVLDGSDNCPLTFNPRTNSTHQVDTDGDGDGDACDEDDDNDQVLDRRDNCPLISNQDQLDTDEDREGNACDGDDDNDGVSDSGDNCPLVANHNQINTDRAADGGDACDGDDDNDGVGDSSDQCPVGETDWTSDPSTDNDGDGCQDASEDSDDDGDGLVDNADQCPAGVTGWTSNPFTDNDRDGCRDADEDEDGGQSGSSGSPPSALEVELTFAPIPGGFRISNQSDFGDFVVLRITATSGENVEVEEVKTGEFVDDSYDFTGIADLEWQFQITGILSDSREQEVSISFVWDENGEDHGSGGIRSGANHDGDGRADSVDEDDDNDGVNDASDQCRVGVINWISNPSTDNDGDGCRDVDEDEDGGQDGFGVSLRPLEVELTFAPIAGGFVISNQSDFGDLVSLNITAVSRSEFVLRIINIAEFADDSYDFTGLADLGWHFQIRGTLSDGRQQEVKIVFIWEENEADHSSGGIRSGVNHDGDGRADSVDEDDDNDGVNDDSDQCPVGVTGWTSNPSTDTDGDGCRDRDEDEDGGQDLELSVRGLYCSAGTNGDCDGDGHGDHVDIDDDGDGLIEIATAAELNAVRYALDGSGSRSAENAGIDTTGCGGVGGITSCSGYELVANISLAAYRDGKGWQPLGHDIDNATYGCQGAAFDGTFEGNGWTISDLSINRSDEDCVGLFGHIAADSEIRYLTLRAEAVTGGNNVGGLMGYGESAQIHSSSVVVGGVRGTNQVGGLMGNSQSVRIFSSSIVAAVVRGDDNVGGLVGSSDLAQIFSSSVVAGQVSGRNEIGGLVGYGESAQIFSSSVVASQVSGRNEIGGLVGYGDSTRIYSSSVVVGEVSGTDDVGGLVGDFGFGQVAYSYVVSGSNTTMLVGDVQTGNGAGVASYWDSETSGINTGNLGAPKPSDELRMPTDYAGIYEDWDDNIDIFGDGMIDEPLAVWCDEDNSGSIESNERTNGNRIWDFGTNTEYPAIRCPPLDPDEWRNWWFLNETGKPQLNQTRLDELLP